MKRRPFSSRCFRCFRRARIGVGRLSHEWIHFVSATGSPRFKIRSDRPTRVRAAGALRWSSARGRGTRHGRGSRRRRSRGGAARGPHQLRCGSGDGAGPGTRLGAFVRGGGPEAAPRGGPRGRGGARPRRQRRRALRRRRRRASRRRRRRGPPVCGGAVPRRRRRCASGARVTRRVSQAIRVCLVELGRLERAARGASRVSRVRAAPRGRRGHAARARRARQRVPRRRDVRTFSRRRRRARRRPPPLVRRRARRVARRRRVGARRGGGPSRVRRGTRAVPGHLRGPRARVGRRPARDGRRHARRPEANRATRRRRARETRGAFRAFRGRRRRGDDVFARDPFTERREHRTQNTERPDERSRTRLAPDARRVGGGARVPPRVRRGIVGGALGRARAKKKRFEYAAKPRASTSNPRRRRVSRRGVSIRPGRGRGPPPRPPPGSACPARGSSWTGSRATARATRVGARTGS